MTDDRVRSREEDADCRECALHAAFGSPAAMERRAFLRAAGLVLTSLGLLGLDARDADATDVGALTPLPGRQDHPEEKGYPIPAADGVSIDKDNSLIIARAAGKVYAFSLACPHQNTALRWLAEDHEFKCPKHHSRYRDDGTFIEGRATRAMDRLGVRRDGATLLVDVDVFYQQDEHPTEWAAAFVTV